MSKKLLFVALFSLLSLSVFAQKVSVQAGLAFPMGDFGDAAGTGFGISGTYEYFLEKGMSLTGSIGYYSFGAKEDIPGFDYSLSNIPIMVGGRYYLGKGEFVPYVGAEVGLNMISTTITMSFFGSPVEVDASSTEFGVNPYVGCKYAISPKLMLDANLKYNVIMSDPSTTYLGINVGVQFGL